MGTSESALIKFTIRYRMPIRTKHACDIMECKMKAKVNKDLCVGCGPCQDICPEVFQIENDLAKVKVEIVPPENQETCYKAMENCPTEAISIEE
jgi:ferredoxin